MIDEEIRNIINRLEKNNDYEASILIQALLEEINILKNGHR